MTSQGDPTRVEHRTVDLADHPHSMDPALDALAADGWEVVSHTAAGVGFSVLLRRRVPIESDKPRIGSETVRR